MPVTKEMTEVATGKRGATSPRQRSGPRTGQLSPPRVHRADRGRRRHPLGAGLGPTDRTLSRIKFWIVLIGGAGIALAAALAAIVATAALRPVRRLTTAAENVTATGDLSERVAVSGHDELGRLARSVQRDARGARGVRRAPAAARRGRLARAAHASDLDPHEHRPAARGAAAAGRGGHALDEASIELAALTTLVSDLVELARGEERKLRVEDVQLDDLVAGAVERARSRAPEATFVTSLSPTVVHADPVLLERAVSNLLDNAVKYSPVGAPIEVDGPRRRGRRRRSWPRRGRGGPAARSSTASIAPRRPARSPAPASGLRSCGRPHGPHGGDAGRSRARRGARASGSPAGYGLAR